MNRLGGAASAYLRSAAHQPVDWYPWSDEAFAAARAADRPDPPRHRRGVVPLVPRDGRRVVRGPGPGRVPQRALRLREGGPRRAARRGRALPARRAGPHRTGRLAAHRLPHAGRRRLLRRHLLPARTGSSAGPGSAPCSSACCEAYRGPARPGCWSRPPQLRGHVAGTLTEGTPGEVTPGAPRRRGASRWRGASTSATAASAPSRSSRTPSAIDFLLARWWDTGEAWLREVVERTLTAMARGGVYDQLGGGFHRYATDERWIVPHFEKMAYDNAELLKVYLHAYAAFGAPLYREVAEGIVRWNLEVMCDRRARRVRGLAGRRRRSRRRRRLLHLDRRRGARRPRRRGVGGGAPPLGHRRRRGRCTTTRGATSSSWRGARRTIAPAAGAPRGGGRAAARRAPPPSCAPSRARRPAPAVDRSRLHQLERDDGGGVPRGGRGAGPRGLPRVRAADARAAVGGGVAARRGDGAPWCAAGADPARRRPRCCWTTRSRRPPRRSRPSSTPATSAGCAAPRTSRHVLTTSFRDPVGGFFDVRRSRPARASSPSAPSPSRTTRRRPPTRWRRWSSCASTPSPATTRTAPKPRRTLARLRRRRRRARRLRRELLPRRSTPCSHGMTTIVVADTTTTISLPLRCAPTARGRWWCPPRLPSPLTSHRCTSSLLPPTPSLCSGTACAPPARTASELRAAMESFARTG